MTNLDRLEKLCYVAYKNEEACYKLIESIPELIQEVKSLCKRLEVAKKALEEIGVPGAVCETFEICNHKSCKSSYEKYAIAQQALLELGEMK